MRHPSLLSAPYRRTATALLAALWLAGCGGGETVPPPAATGPATPPPVAAPPSPVGPPPTGTLELGGGLPGVPGELRPGNG